MTQKSKEPIWFSGVELGEGNLSIVDRFCEFKVYSPLGHLLARSQNIFPEGLDVDWAVIKQGVGWLGMIG